MADWSDRLCEVLDAAEGGLAAAAGLKPGLSSQEFEEALGALLRWQELRPLSRRFMDLGGPTPGSHQGEVEASYTREDGRLQTIMANLNSSLYDEFGTGRISL